MDVKAAITRLRQSLGSRSDSELAEAVGVPFHTLNSWKKRNSIPSSELIDICERNGLSLDFIVFGQNTARPAKQSWEAAAASIGLRMALKTAGLPEDQKRNLEHQIQIFTGWCQRLIQHEIFDLGLNVDDTIAKFERILEQQPEVRLSLAHNTVTVPLPDEGGEE